MAPDQFLHLVKNFSALHPEDAAMLEQLAKDYPYAQGIRAMLARAAQDNQRADQQHLLHLAATYAADRAVLKWVMTAPRTEVAPSLEPAPVAEPTVEPPAAPAIVTPAAESIPEEVITAPVAPVTEPVTPPAKETIPDLHDDALRADVLAELDKLQHLKHAFEDAVDAYQHHEPVKATTTPARPMTEEPAQDPLIEEIRTARATLPIENPTQLEQIQMIDAFIQTGPIRKKPVPSPEQKDLAEDSGALSDNVVSETLVQLLVSQGRKDKAIEVLKKLIWKFPQKKAYFAAQIDELKR